MPADVVIRVKGIEKLFFEIPHRASHLSRTIGNSKFHTRSSVIRSKKDTCEECARGSRMCTAYFSDLCISFLQQPFDQFACFVTLSGCYALIRLTEPSSHILRGVWRVLPVLCATHVGGKIIIPSQKREKERKRREEKEKRKFKTQLQ